MAFSTKTSLFFFLVTTLALQIHARDSYFFGKFHRETPKDQNPNNNVLPLETSEKTTVQESIHNKKDQEQDPTFVPESENGYGLYGHETTYNNNKEEFSNNNNNKYNEKVNGEIFSTPSLSETEESYNNKNKYDEKYPKKIDSYDQNGYNNEVFKNKDNNVKEETFSKNNEDKRSFYNYNYGNYGTELERETPYKGYSHDLVERPQGMMSDTRSVEKGKNYYNKDLYKERNRGGFYRKSQGTNPNGYSYGHNNEEEEKRFKEPYGYKNTMMNEEPEEFLEEQRDMFKP
ncbi:unnamed protein product [Cochlearia groenlandica]